MAFNPKSIVRSTIVALGLGLVALACGSQNGEDVESSAAALSHGPWVYACSTTNECASTSLATCGNTPGCTIANVDAGPNVTPTCVQKTLCPPETETTTECTSNPQCEVTARVRGCIAPC